MVWRFSFPACHQCKPRFSTLKEPVKTRETRECVLCSKLFTVDLLLYTECKALFSWVIYCSRNNFISQNSVCVKIHGNRVFRYSHYYQSKIKRIEKNRMLIYTECCNMIYDMQLWKYMLNDMLKILNLWLPLERLNVTVTKNKLPQILCGIK